MLALDQLKEKKPKRRLFKLPDLNQVGFIVPANQLSENDLKRSLKDLEEKKFNIYIKYKLE
jgi:hypothetical protein